MPLYDSFFHHKQIRRSGDQTPGKIRDDIPPRERRPHQRPDKPVLDAQHIAQRKYLRHLDDNGNQEHRSGEPYEFVGYHDPNDAPDEDHDKSVAKVRADEGIVNEETDEDLDNEKYNRRYGEEEALSFHVIRYRTGLQSYRFLRIFGS